MTFKTISGPAMTGAALGALMLASAAQAQTASPAPMSVSEVEALPPEYRSGPIVTDQTETMIDADGVETIVRTRRIESTAPHYDSYADQGEYADHTTYSYRSVPPQGYSHGYSSGYAPGYVAGASVFERDQWVAECERRTSGRSNREKGGIIGGLLGAIVGGIAGNRIADAGERLGGLDVGAAAAEHPGEEDHRRR